MPKIFLSSFLLLVGFFSLFGQTPNEKKSSPQSKSSYYDESWDHVKNLEEEGKTRSALKALEEIYDKAKLEKNSPMLVKSILHKLKYTSILEADEFYSVFNKMRKEVKSAPSPTRQILHSVLAEMYWMYYQKNRHIFLGRTKVEGKPDSDVRKWDLSTIVHFSMKNYAKSLEEAETLKKISIQDIEPILTYHKNSDNLRPTLYDFLLHRAIDFYANGESGLTVPKERFYISKDTISQKGKVDYSLYHSDIETFLSTEISEIEKDSFPYLAIIHFKDLLRFRLSEYQSSEGSLKNTNLSALLDADLKRHQFIYKNSIDPSRKKYYINALEELKSRNSSHPVSAEVSFLLAQEYSTSASLYNPLHGNNYQDDAKKAVDLCVTASYEFPKSYGGINCESILSTLKEKQIGITIQSHQVPGSNFPILLRYKNIEMASFYIFPFSDGDLDNIRNLYEEERRKSGYIPVESVVFKYFSGRNPLKNFKISLQNPKDYNSHSSEIIMPELPAGEYILFASAEGNITKEKNGIAFESFRVTNISYINRNVDNTFQFHLLHRKTGLPISDATITQLETNFESTKKKILPNVIRNLKSDSNGFFSVPQRDKTYLNYYFEVKALGETYYIGNPLTPLADSIRSMFYQGVMGAPRDTESINRNVFFFTDRSIYRPGQKLYFKSILLETNGKTSKVLSGEDVVVQILDANRTKISELTLKTNEFGSISGNFILPTSGLRGRYTILSSNWSGSQSFSVEEYKRPKFKVSLEKPTSEYKLGDTVKIKGTAKAYSGAPISNARLKFTVHRNAIFPRWDYGYGFFPPVSPESIVGLGELETNENGDFQISFDAVADESISRTYEPVFRYKISCEITDSNGETISQNLTIPIGTVSALLSLNIPGYVLKNSFSEIKIDSKNLSGESLNTEGKLEISRLQEPEIPLRSRPYERGDRFLYSKEEWKSSLPDYPYEKENEREFYPVLETVFSGNFQSGNSIQPGDTKKWKTGMYSAQVSGKDSFGRDIKDKKFFYFVDPEEKKVPFTDPSFFFIYRNTIEPGNNLQILLSNKYREKGLLELELDGKIFQSVWVDSSRKDSEYFFYEYPITQKERGNFGVHYTFVYNNKLYSLKETIRVPRTDKELKISIGTHRSILQPGEEESWNLKIEGSQKDKFLAEMVGTLYDASLDSILPHKFQMDIYSLYTPYMNWGSENGFQISNGYSYSENWNTPVYPKYRQYRSLNWFGYQFTYNQPVMYKRMHSPMMEDRVAESPPLPSAAVTRKEASSPETPKKKDETPKPQIEVRSDFRETAFFYPDLKTDENGNILVSFKLPESLTTWRFLGFAHTPDMKFGFVEDEIKAQKKFMVVPGLPRFLREGDTMELAVKLTNLSQEDLWGKADLVFLDPTTGKDISSLFFSTRKTSDEFETSFEVKKNLSNSISWKVKIPKGLSSVLIRTSASSGKYSDGEESLLPILTNRMLVTETLPLSVTGKGNKSFGFKKLLESESSGSLKHHNLSLEFTSNPVWLTIASLPYLAEYPYECMEQTFSRYYANSISRWIVEKNPEIEKVFQKWKKAPKSEQNALLSNLEKNEDLKSAFLEETPWVLQGKNESENKQKIANLFQNEKLLLESKRAVQKLKENQTIDGSFSWFKGMPGDRYITQHILGGFGHMKKIGIPQEDTVVRMTESSLRYLDKKIREDYEYLKEEDRKKRLSLSDNHLNPLVIHYLYTRSFYTDKKISDANKESFEYFLNQAKKYKYTTSFYLRGMIALTLHRFGDTNTAKNIVNSLKENSIQNAELGNYWKTRWSYYWYELPVETQSLLIECFYEIEGDSEFLSGMKLWLLKHKQTNQWSTTKSTSDAIYALLLGDTGWKSTKIPEISLGDIVISSDSPDFKSEAGTGYFKKSFNQEQISPSMGTIRIKNNSNRPAFGGVYWQYFQNLDKITPAETPLKIEKKLFLMKTSSKGNTLVPLNGENLKIGDTIKVRIELSTDRDMEYVHLKDMRASSLEPTNVLSTYKFRDGLGYYESTRDASVNFFIDRLPKGVYVLEYSLKVTQKGNFSNGITTIQSMYAPEFSSHSEGIRFTVN